jgi:hypothetical protein
MNDVKEMIDGCVMAMDAGRLTKWEENFIEQIQEDWDSGWRKFSEERLEKLREIYAQRVP